mgnify:CR=1 FL=1
MHGFLDHRRVVYSSFRHSSTLGRKTPEDTLVEETKIHHIHNPHTVQGNQGIFKPDFQASYTSASQNLIPRIPWPIFIGCDLYVETPSHCPLLIGWEFLLNFLPLQFFSWIPIIEQKNKIFFKPDGRWFSRALIKNFMESDFCV